MITQVRTIRTHAVESEKTTEITERSPSRTDVGFRYLVVSLFLLAGMLASHLLCYWLMPRFLNGVFDKSLAWFWDTFL